MAPLATISWTDPKDWKKIPEGKSGRKVSPIEYTPRPEDAAFRSDADPTGELFDVKITAEEVEAMKDKNGDIWFEKVAGHLLPTFDNKTYWEFIAARMRNLYVTPNPNDRIQAPFL